MPFFTFHFPPHPIHHPQDQIMNKNYFTVIDAKIIYNGDNCSIECQFLGQDTCHLFNDIVVANNDLSLYERCPICKQRTQIND